MKILYSLLPLLFFSFFLSAQQTDKAPDHKLHECAETHIKSNIKNGTYDQNPLMWNFDVSFYKLDIEVEPTATTIDGSVRIIAQAITDNFNTIVVELMDDMTVNNVAFTEGDDLSFNHSNNEIEIMLPSSIDSGEEFDITIFYGGTPEPEGFFAGISSEISPTGHPVLWTLSEPLNARQWWPVKQVLEDKADSVHVFITTSSEYTAASNGLLSEIVNIEGNKRRFEWKSKYPIAYYLISIAVSNYAEHNFYAPQSGSSEPVWVQNFIYDDIDFYASIYENLELTKDYMTAFSFLYGDYPFADEKYGHASAPMGGAMEHQTLSTMGSFNPDIISHELAHHWFGNYVTCATWSDIWINEGFASYSEFLAREFVFGEESAKQWMESAHNIVLSQPNGSVYIPPYQTTDIWRIFDGRLSYKKGAAILHILRHEINDDEMFFDILKSFQETYKNDVATGDDFKNEVEMISNITWDWFFNQWYYGEGHPIYNIIWWQIDNTLFISIEQTTSAEVPEFFRASLDFNVIYNNETEEKIRLSNETNQQSFHISAEEDIKELIFDPDNKILKEYSLNTLNESITGIEPIILPNPFSDEIKIILPYDTMNCDLIIYNLEGNIILRQKLRGHINYINTEGIQEGLYILQIIEESGKAIHRKKALKIKF